MKRKAGEPDTDAFNVAVRLLTRRTHTRFELARKLRQRGFEPEQVESTLQRATELGWLNDEAAARQYIEEQIRKGGHGRRWIEAKLGEKGIERELSCRLLDEIWNVDLEREFVLRFVNNWTVRNASKKAEKSYRNRAVQAVIRRGFATDLARLAVEEAIGRRDGEQVS